MFFAARNKANRPVTAGEKKTNATKVQKISTLQPTLITYTEWELELFWFIPTLNRVYVLMHVSDIIQKFL